MPAKILQGEPIAKQIKQRIADEIYTRSNKGLRPPVLAVILVGEHKPSIIYVKHKKVACQQVGIQTLNHDLPANISELELLKLIQELNLNPQVDGILVQLPLPSHINPDAIIESIDPTKDVDGFHPYNLGRLAQGRPTLRPCTPAGIMALLAETGVSLTGKTACVLGRSNIVGLPMVLELMQANVTVTSCNAMTIDIKTAVQHADIIIVATGNAELVKGDWIKQGAIVIDVGMNHTADGNLIGDVEFEAAKLRAAWITPVPGGVGPMTIAYLLSNTLAANINRATL